MSFGEKSAWMLGLTSLVVGGLYAWLILGRGGLDAPGPILTATIGFIVLTILTHIVIVMMNPHTADLRDERDALIGHRAETVGSFVLAAATFGVVVLAAMSEQWLIANLAFGGLIAAELVKALSQIVLYRRTG